MIQWTPTNGQVGMQAVTVRVQDVGWRFATQGYSIDVAAVNHKPEITSTAVTTATEDTLYSYDVQTSDSDLGDTLTYALDVAPKWNDDRQRIWPDAVDAHERSRRLEFGDRARGRQCGRIRHTVIRRNGRKHQ